MFTTNPLSLANGAAGIALFLREAEVVDSAYLDRVAAWMLERPITVEAYPPGLHTGLAGIALAVHRMGRHADAGRLMALGYDSPLLHAEADLFHGAAGWGWASLWFHNVTGKAEYLARAVAAGEHLLETAEEAPEGLCWATRADGRVQLGWGHGAAGIGLFLLELGEATANTAFTDAAVRALDFDLAHGAVDENGLSWPTHRGATRMMPYLGHGAAGIGAVLVRFAERLGAWTYREKAVETAEATFMKWSVQPSLMYGLAGIGELMLDAHRLTGEARYRNYALEIAETVCWYALKRPEGIAFPGDMLTRISTDYATGSAGIGLFLMRLLAGRPNRLLLDL